jgi:hypothetical protein
MLVIVETGMSTLRWILLGRSWRSHFDRVEGRVEMMISSMLLVAMVSRTTVVVSGSTATSPTALGLLHDSVTDWVC